MSKQQNLSTKYLSHKIITMSTTSKLIPFILALTIMSSAVIAQYDILQFYNDSDGFSTDLVATQDGNYVALSFDFIFEDQESKYRFHLFKFSEDGYIIWEKYFINPKLGPVPFFVHPKLLQLNDNSFIILYANKNPQISGIDPFSLAIKVDQNGNKIWEKEYECCFYGLIERSNGEVWLGGDTKEIKQDLSIKRINTQGNELSTWDYSYSLDGVDAPEQGYQISSNTNNEIILSGMRNFGNSDMVHFRIAPDGTVMSELELGNPNQINHDQNIINTSDGGSMYINSYALDDHYLISKVNALGAFEWSKEFKTDENVRDFNDFIAWNQGAVAVGLEKTNGQSGPSNLAISFFDLNGNIQNDIVFDIEGKAERIVSVVPSHTGGLMYLGWVNQENSFGDSSLNPFIFTTDAFGNSMISSVNFLEFDNVTVFPNPTSSTTTLNIQNVKLQKGILKIFNASGQLMYQKQINNNSHEIEQSNWPAGLYYLQILHSNELVWTGKLVVK